MFFAKAGERNIKAKLTLGQVLEIKRQLGYREQKDIAKEFGVTKPTISRINTGRGWTWLALEDAEDNYYTHDAYIGERE